MPLYSAITVSLVPEARGGPFVFWGDLNTACQTAAELGFDAIELFPPSAMEVNAAQLRRLLDSHRLKLAAVGTGAGWLKHRLSLSSADRTTRQRAVTFVTGVIDLAAEFAAPAVIGSMQGRFGDTSAGQFGDGESARAALRESLCALADHAKNRARPLLYEPLNRYETNLANTVAAGLELVDSPGCANVQLLADLFHMNIEEADIGQALRTAGARLGHVHFVDSNRRPAGCGHLDYRPIAAALREITYSGYASAEALPWPDSRAAAQQTIQSFRRWLS
ncbi:MAG TPA: sugar phosphate isomerase/epimerase family protein [Pirellulales bacterium]|nr:sugar phosphate isomerase/epimerase family protein [Pirellulales bacterium]